MNFIDKIYVVHYSPLKDRKEFMLKQFALFNITNYEFVEGPNRNELTDELVNKHYRRKDNIDVTSAEIAITITHIEIYKDIIKNDYKTCLILEDDAILCEDFTTYFTRYMKCLPSDYDMAFINDGACLHDERAVPDIIWYKQTSTRTCCGYIVTNKACEDLLSEILPFSIPIDYAITDIIRKKNLNVYWCEPTIILDGSHMYGSSHNINQLGKYLNMYKNYEL
jgi:GR25 family glycosyltransferase involved in LPS biosynthesis